VAWNASTMASAAMAPLFSASITPEENTGSRNPNASPASSRPSPRNNRERQENSLVRRYGPTGVPQAKWALIHAFCSISR